MRFFLYWFLIIPTLLFCEWDELFRGSGDPCTVQNVNVISGNLQLFSEDISVNGAVPLRLTRSYSSSGASERGDKKVIKLSKLNLIWQLEGGWNILPHLQMIVDPGANLHANLRVYLREPNGQMIVYGQRDYKWDLSEYILTPLDTMNREMETINGRLNPKNNVLTINYKKGQAIVKCADGGSRIYEGKKSGIKDILAPSIPDLKRNVVCYLLQEEISPSGQRTSYYYHDYSEGKPKRIEITKTNPSGTKQYSSLSIIKSGSKSPFSVEVTSSDSRRITYQGWAFKDQDYLASVSNGTTVLDDISYIKTRKGQGASINQINSWGEEELQVEYHRPNSEQNETKWKKNPDEKPYEIDKVKSISKCGVLLAKFSYMPDATDVRDCDNVLTRYHHQDGLLQEIEYFDETQELYSSQKFIWNEHNLIAKVMKTKNGDPVFSKTLECDDYGNILTESLYGNFSGKNPGPFQASETGELIGAEKHTREYCYDKTSHLIVEEAELNGLVHKYTYLNGTDLVLTKTTEIDGNLLLTQSFEYDEDNLLISEKNEDGIISSEKRYERDAHGKIIAIEDNLSRTEYLYSKHNQVIQESVFDTNGDFAYHINYKYNDQGRLLSQSTPSGKLNTYSYAPCGDLLACKEAGKPRIEFTYDNFHRPIMSSSNGKTRHTTYTPKGLISSTTDTFTGTIKYQYDAFNRSILTIFPKVLDENGDLYHPTMECGYDLYGNTTYCKNGKGEVKRSHYNILSKPTHEIFPDGSEIRNFYDTKGNLVQTIDQEGSETFYAYDGFGQMILKKGPLFEESWHYSPLKLLSYTDQTGLTTTFEYDSYGRKTVENRQGRKTEYTYDKFNLLESVTTGTIVTTETHDVEGKIVSKIECGENLTLYDYDDENRPKNVRKITSIGESVDTVEYDEDGKIISHTDPMGATTQFLYKPLEKITIDPLRNSTIERYDPLERLIEIEKKSSDGTTIFREKNFYDRSGNLARKISYNYLNGIFIKQSEILWDYDFRGLVVKEQQLDKTTLNKYDSLGRLIKRTLPNKVTLEHTYDQASRLTSLISSDGTINYSYKYGSGLNPILIEDHIHGTCLQREYSPFGELIREINDQNLSLQWEYDDLGRETSLTLPDQSKITYLHEGNHMKKVERLSSNGTPLYSHIYDEFDQNGHVYKESLIYGIGTVITKHDLLERPYLVNSPHHTETITYDLSGLVTSVQNSLFHQKVYEYDPLKQLRKENETKYNFDSIGNNSQLDVNEYNELSSKFIYDKAGNPIKRIEDQASYQYDALGRLIHISDAKNRQIEFVYDAYSRLSLKIVNGEKKQYIYDQEYEIGTLKEDGTFLDLKVIGLGINQDIGAAIAIEIGGNIYAPLHDFHGNIIALVAKTGEIKETINYNAFGKEELYRAELSKAECDTDLSPWRFCSKRKEEGLVYFGKRFYDTEYGRWLTPDPLGFAESTNVYLYTQNSPLNRLDLFGLYSEAEKGFYFRPSSLHEQGGYSSSMRSNPPRVLFCKALLTNAPNANLFDCIVISGNLHKMQFTPQELLKDRANLLDHMHELVPKNSGIIGLVTAQNGIYTTPADFLDNCMSLTRNINEGTLFIGLHNRSEGLNEDRKRCKNERINREMTQQAVNTGQFLGIIADAMGKIQSKSYWLHIPHSEAGILFNLGYTMLEPHQKALLKNQLIVFAVAPLEPISWQHCFKADNIYSDKDGITDRYGKKYLNNPDYNITITKCTTPVSERIAYYADHYFTGRTYSEATTRQIKTLRNNYGFYDSRKR